MKIKLVIINIKNFMGASLTFLDKPNTDIEYHSGESKEFKTRFVAADMQGWRLNMVRTLLLLIYLGQIGGRVHLKPRIR